MLLCQPSLCISLSAHSSPGIRYNRIITGAEPRYNSAALTSEQILSCAQVLPDFHLKFGRIGLSKIQLRTGALSEWQCNETKNRAAALGASSVLNILHFERSIFYRFVASCRTSPTCRTSPIQTAKLFMRNGLSETADWPSLTSSFHRF